MNSEDSVIQHLLPLAENNARLRTISCSTRMAKKAKKKGVSQWVGWEDSAQVEVTIYLGKIYITDVRVKEV